MYLLIYHQHQPFMDQQVFSSSPAIGTWRCSFWDGILFKGLTFQGVVCFQLPVLNMCIMYNIDIIFIEHIHIFVYMYTFVHRYICIHMVFPNHDYYSKFNIKFFPFWRRCHDVHLWHTPLRLNVETEDLGTNGSEGGCGKGCLGRYSIHAHTRWQSSCLVEMGCGRLEQKNSKRQRRMMNLNKYICIYLYIHIYICICICIPRTNLPLYMYSPYIFLYK